MSQYQCPYPPAQHLQIQRQKNKQLYQQLLQSNYLSERLYTTEQLNHNHAAHIKFSASPLKSPVEMDTTQDKQDTFIKCAKISSPNKTYQSIGKINLQSHQATPSLFSNYSIIEMQNESYSTINMYSNPLQSNLDVSLQNITNKFILEGEKIDNGLKQESIIHSNMILQNSSKIQQNSSFLQGEDYKKYHSQQYRNNFKQKPINEQAEEMMIDKNKMPKMIAEKHKKENLIKKLSFDANQNQNNHFKTTNQIHVMPYRINQQMQPFTYAFPVSHEPNHFNGHIISMVDQSPKKGTLYFNNSHQSLHGSQEEIQSSNQHIFSSNYSNQQSNNEKRVGIASNIGYHNSQKSNCNRYTPKSEPKHQKSYSNQNQTRSNSIDYKSKSKTVVLQMREAKKHTSSLGNMLEKGDQSRATKIFKNGLASSQQQLGQPYGSVLFETSVVSLCCGTSESKPLNANKINFKSKRQEEHQKEGCQAKSPFICDFMSSADISNAPSYLKSKLPSYKINPIHSIKNLNDTTESSKDGKKGIKLLGFNSGFCAQK